MYSDHRIATTDSFVVAMTWTCFAALHCLVELKLPEASRLESAVRVSKENCCSVYDICMLDPQFANLNIYFTSYFLSSCD